MSGMADNEGDFDFSDAEFDTLAADELDHLESHAILSTQQPQAHHTSGPAAKSPVLRPNVYQVPLELQQLPAQGVIQFSRPPELLENYDSFDGTLPGEDDGVTTPRHDRPTLSARRRDLNEANQREQSRAHRFGQALRGTDDAQNQQGQHNSRHVNGNNGVNKPNGRTYVPDAMQLQDGLNRPDQARPGESDALQAQLQQLLSEREDLAEKLKTASDEISRQKGEISVIRENNATALKVSERQQAQLRKAMQDESARLQTILQNEKVERNTLFDEYRFLKQELDREGEKTRTLQRQLKDLPRVERFDDEITTPRKRLENSLRDGFDDAEIMAVSPMKSGRRSKPGTPTRAKRKRNGGGTTPIAPLVLRPSSQAAIDNASQEPQAEVKPERVAPIVRRDRVAERNLGFVQKILDFCPRDKHRRLVEILMDYAFRSDTSRTFSSIVLEETAKLSGKRLPAELLDIFTRLWSKSLDERYYECVSLLNQVIDYVIVLDMSVVDTGTIKSLLPILQRTAEVNAAKRFKNSPVSHTTLGQLRQTPQSELNHDLNGTACLETLYTIACIVSDEQDLITVFWGVIETNFILMMLNSSQPIRDMTLMLQLLSTSILPTTFGNVQNSPAGQVKMETWTLDRVCCLLWEIPQVDQGVASYTRSTVCTFRLEVLGLLTQLGITSSAHPHTDPTHHGSLILAQHRTAIARIVRSIYDELDAMYAMSPSHSLHADIVNKGVRLLYHILQLHGENIDMQQKLRAVNGAVHKHKVALTRLAFSEGFVLDRLITDETVSMARDMLEESVTPDEGDQLMEAFPKFQGRRGEAQEG